MTKTGVRGTALALAALGTALAATGAGAQERFTLRGERAAVYNLAGEVRVEAGSGSEVEVEVARGGADAGALRLERGERGGAEALVVVYPGDRVVYDRMGRGSNTSLNVRRDGTWGHGDRGILGGGRRVTIAGSGSGTEAHADLVVRVPAGRTLTVHQAVGAVAVTNVRGDLTVRTASAAVRASGTRGQLLVDVGSGSVEVRDAEGDIDLDTGSGSVRVDGVRGERLHVDTGSGGVRGAGVEMEEILVDVGSGGVNLDGVAAREVDVDTGSGSVQLSLVRQARRVHVDTGSGGVRLALPEGYDAELEIDTGSGGIDVDLPLEARRASRSHLTGRLGSGGGQIEIDTGSGGVRLTRS